MKDRSSSMWFPVELRSCQFGYVERPLFSDFSLKIEKPGFYLVDPVDHINAGIYLLRMLAGLSRPSFGDILVNGNSLLSMSFEEFLPLRLKMSYAFDVGGLLSNKSLRDNLILPLAYHRFYEPKEASHIVDAAMERYGLRDVSGERPADLGRSDYKMTLLLRSLLHNPEYILLDEPEEGLDSARFEIFGQDLGERFDRGDLTLIVYTSIDRHLFRSQDQYRLVATSSSSEIASIIQEEAS